MFCKSLSHRCTPGRFKIGSVISSVSADESSIAACEDDLLDCFLAGAAGCFRFGSVPSYVSDDESPIKICDDDRPDFFLQVQLVA